MLCLAVTYQIRPGKEDEAVARMRAMTVASRAEPGCRFYQAHRSASDPRRFFLYEQYDDAAALEAHRASPAYVEHVEGGLWTICESRAPEFYESLPD